MMHLCLTMMALFSDYFWACMVRLDYHLPLLIAVAIEPNAFFDLEVLLAGAIILTRHGPERDFTSKLAVLPFRFTALVLFPASAYLWHLPAMPCDERLCIPRFGTTIKSITGLRFMKKYLGIGRLVSGFPLLSSWLCFQ